ncbi:IspD 4-diphosphocytidyl-2-methyl-D-erithritol synthase [Rhabdaerophilaceae bacterium]
MTNTAAALIIVAAGRGTRLGGQPKQYRELDGKPVLAHLLTRASAISALGPLIVVVHPDDGQPFEQAVAASKVDPARVFRAHGGSSRQASVHNGLELLAAAGFDPGQIVLIHDAARPFLSEVVVLRAILAAQKHGAAIPVLPIADTIGELGPGETLVNNPDRAKLRIVQTPQAFRFEAILDAHRQMAGAGRSDFTDDAGLVRSERGVVGTFAGEPALFKITLEADLLRAEEELRRGQTISTRTGIGYDVHAFCNGDHVMLGGVAVAHDQALSGHSDADPLLHAITDALLGTIGDGDIGQHFPPGDPRWRGAQSRIFLDDARRRVESKGGRIVHIDATVVCEAPKVGPHRAAIAASIADILGLSPADIGVKATTSEKLGFTGRREGIAAIAVATVAITGQV